MAENLNHRINQLIPYASFHPLPGRRGGHQTLRAPIKIIRSSDSVSRLTWASERTRALGRVPQYPFPKFTEARTVARIPFQISAPDGEDA
jgi:hypothetical protein